MGSYAQVPEILSAVRGSSVRRGSERRPVRATVPVRGRKGLLGGGLAGGSAGLG